MTGVENILLRPPRSERKVPTGLATFEWVGAGGRRGRWSNAAKPPAPGVLAFWVAVARWGRRSASPRPLSGPGRQPAARLGHSGLGGRPARPHPAPHRGLCPKSPQPFWLPRGSAFPETQGAVGCKGLNKRQAVFHCYWQKNSCLVPRESPPNPQFCRFAQRALEKCPGGRKSSCVPWGWRINVTPTESCQPCPKAMSPWHLGRGPPCPPTLWHPHLCWEPQSWESPQCQLPFPSQGSHSWVGGASCCPSFP